MTGRKSTLLVAQSQAERLVRLISAREGLEQPRVEWVDGSGGRVHRTRAGGLRLVLGRGILDDVEDARFTIAHELGHVARGHVERRTTYWTFGLLAGSAGAVLLVLAVTGVTMRGVDGLALLGFAPMTIVIAHRPLVRYLVQPRELEADDFAAKQQCQLSGRLAERYQAARTRDDRLLNWVYPTHPSWSTRAARQLGGSAQ